MSLPLFGGCATLAVMHKAPVVHPDCAHRIGDGETHCVPVSWAPRVSLGTGYVREEARCIKRYKNVMCFLVESSLNDLAHFKLPE